MSRKVAIIPPTFYGEPRRRQAQRVEDVAIDIEGAQRQPVGGEEELFVGYGVIGCTAIFLVLLLVVAIVFYVRFT
ncbi:hypothetical protein GCK72_004694 [Caenorhabditis remanei]|uniref:Uncharacterized protein n=1 Tax=Caenorhabditis remanei TaxID=31234 RepID=A0A6A5HD09_CAERE|nr:hypothetical protein GCK72_004694 [Caenorhabditis remanei]KAF1764744.1 hypothetical protein GCK72_004694 [Caenorhabditis remanei]